MKCKRCADLETENTELRKLNLELTKGQADLLRAGTDAVRKMISTGSELVRAREPKAPVVARPQKIERTKREPFRPTRDVEAEFAETKAAN